MCILWTILGQKHVKIIRLNPKNIETTGCLTNFGRMCHVNKHTKSLLNPDIGKWVIFKMTSIMTVSILQ